MTLAVVTDLTEPPRIGHYYLVPCVRYWYDSRLAWWPVVGPKHEDAEHLNFSAVHYHLDRRFLPERMLRNRGGYSHRRGDRSRFWRSADTDIAARPLSEFCERESLSGRHLEGGPLPAPVLRKRRCIVADVGFPGRADEGVHPQFDRFHAAYEGRRCGRNADGQLVCPHKGAALGSLAPDRNGIVTCPLHGLAIDTRNGVVVRRPRVGGDTVR